MPGNNGGTYLYRDDTALQGKFLRLDKQTLEWLKKIKHAESLETDNQLIEFLLMALKYKKEHLFEPKKYTEEDEYRRAVYARFVKTYNR